MQCLLMLDNLKFKRLVWTSEKMCLILDPSLQDLIDAMLICAANRVIAWSIHGGRLVIGCIVELLYKEIFKTCERF